MDDIISNYLKSDETSIRIDFFRNMKKEIIVKDNGFVKHK